MAPKTLIRVIWCPSAYDSWAFGTLLKSKKKRSFKPNTMTHIDENIQCKNYNLKVFVVLFSCWISGFTQRNCSLCSQGSSLLLKYLLLWEKILQIIRWPPRRRDRFASCENIVSRSQACPPPTNSLIETMGNSRIRCLENREVTVLFSSR